MTIIFMHSPNLIGISQTAFEMAPIPMPLQWLVSALTTTLRLYRGYNRVLMNTNPQVDFKSLLSAEFVNILIDQNKNAQKIVEIMAVVVNIQDLIQCHLDVVQALENTIKAFKGTYPFYEKKRWNITNKKGFLTFGFHHVSQRFKKVVECIKEIFIQLFLLSDSYLTHYDLIHSDHSTRNDAVKKLFLHPKKPLHDFINKEAGLRSFIDNHQKIIDHLLSKTHFVNAETLKYNFSLITSVSKKTDRFISKGKALSGLLSPLADFNLNFFNGESQTDRECYANLGLTPLKSSEEKPFPNWIGQETFVQSITPKKEILSNLPQQKNTPDTTTEIPFSERWGAVTHEAIAKVSNFINRKFFT